MIMHQLQLLNEKIFTNGNCIWLVMKWLWNFSRHCAGIFLHGQEQEAHTHKNARQDSWYPDQHLNKCSTVLAFAGYKYHNKQCMHIQSCKCDFLTLKNKSLLPYYICIYVGLISAWSWNTITCRNAVNAEVKLSFMLLPPSSLSTVIIMCIGGMYI